MMQSTNAPASVSASAHGGLNRPREGCSAQVMLLDQTLFKNGKEPRWSSACQQFRRRHRGMDGDGVAHTCFIFTPVCIETFAGTSPTHSGRREKRFRVSFLGCSYCDKG